MKQLSFPISFRFATLVVVVALMLFYISCRKADKPLFVDKENNIEIVNKFFNSHLPQNATVVGIRNWLKAHHDKEPLVRTFVERAGYPRWDKARVFADFRSQRGSTRNDNIVNSMLTYIPFVREGEITVNGLMVVKTSEVDTTNTFLMDWQYDNVGFDTSIVGNARDRFSLFAEFNKDVFGHTDFIVNDGRIFGKTEIDTLKVTLLNNDVYARQAITYCNPVYVCTPPYKAFRQATAENAMAGECGWDSYYTTVCHTVYFPGGGEPGGGSGGGGGSGEVGTGGGGGSGGGGGGSSGSGGGNNGTTAPEPPPYCDVNCSPGWEVPVPSDDPDFIFYQSLSQQQKAFWNAPANSAFREAFSQYLHTKGFTDEAEDFIKEVITRIINDSSLTLEYFWYNKTDLDTGGEEDNYEEGGYDLTTYPIFDPQQQGWPTITSVIPQSKFVGWNRSQYPNWQCMEYAKEQLRVMGYQISSYYAVGQTFQIFTAQNGVNTEQLSQGLSYLKYALSNNIPVIVGVDNAPGHPGNLDNTTDHFIVIVGMGSDSNGKYFQFYDNATGFMPIGTHESNKLYYNETTKKITGNSAVPSALTYTITMIRKSKLL